MRFTFRLGNEKGQLTFCFVQIALPKIKETKAKIDFYFAVLAPSSVNSGNLGKQFDDHRKTFITNCCKFVNEWIVFYVVNSIYKCSLGMYVQMAAACNFYVQDYLKN